MAPLSRTVSLFEIFSDENDVKAVTEILVRGKQWADGPEIRMFEEKIADYAERKYALTFNNGTSALHAALLAHGLGVGDEVIVPSFTFISTANTVLLAGAKPVFADIEKDSYGLDPESVKTKITKKTKAILPIHYGGAPCKEIQALQEIASDSKILLIEDAAEALGSQIDGRKVGTHGDSAMYSFCQNKIITTGEGGAIVTDSNELYEKLRLFRSHGRQEIGTNYFTTNKPLDYIQIGFNYRMPTMCAALGISQLQKIEKLIATRQRIAKSLTEKLEDNPLLTPPHQAPGTRHIYQMYTVELKEPEKREALQQHLLEKGVMTKIYFSPVHFEPFYRNLYHLNKGALPVTESVSERVLTLPMHPRLTEEDVEYIVDSVESFQG